MSAAKYDLKIDQGARFAMMLTMTDQTGARKDVTGAVCHGQIRKTYSDPTVLAEFTFLVLDQTVTEQRGMIQMSLTAADTKAIPVHDFDGAATPRIKYVYDVFVSDDRVLTGYAYVTPSVTREVTP